VSEQAVLLEALDNLHAEATGQGGTYGFTREAVRALLPMHRCRSCGEGLCDPCVALLVVLYEPLLAAIDEAVKAEREACASLMEGGPERLPGTFTQSDLCRLVEHAQDMCECSERARAIRERGTR